MALDWADYLRSHAERIYSCGSTLVEQGALLIAERRAELPATFKARDIRRKNWAGLGGDADAIEAAIDLLVDHGYCRALPVTTTNAGGRPTTAFEWNPNLKAEN